jgi:hypothetical protein
MRHASLQLHLPQPVLRVRITQSEESVAIVVRLDADNAVRVAPKAYWRLHTSLDLRLITGWETVPTMHPGCNSYRK